MGAKQRGAPRRRRSGCEISIVVVAIWALCYCGAPPARAEEACSGRDDEIVTDRPDVTNSSIVIPAGSLQNENGINLTGRGTGRIFDGTNSRLRLGVAPCVELLMDVPTYFAALRGHGEDVGFTNVAPAVKWQLGPLPGDIDLSATAGAGLPTGTTRLTGRGVQPYLQFPWSRELGGGWGLSGMVTAFFFPSEPSKRTIEPTFVIEREVGNHADVFVEYAGDFRAHAGPSHLVNSGAAYRLTPHQQVDLHVAFGLNRAAPSYIIGVGYSIRFDRLF
jgi:Putative MetA-pathway of phenol degradation